MRERYFIHGNGQTAECAPKGFTAHTMPGHERDNWDKSQYSIRKLVEFYSERIPRNAIVLGHSLGGHIGLNVALKRPDIFLVVSGMAPISNPATMGELFSPPECFGKFQNPARTADDILEFCKFSSGNSEDAQKKLVSMANKQDPNFNLTLFTEGFGDYDWNEVEKAQSIAERFVLILCASEFAYIPDKVAQLDIPMIKTDYQGHTPWLADEGWIDWLENELMARVRAQNTAMSNVEMTQPSLV